MAIWSWRVPAGIIALACIGGAELRAQEPFHCSTAPVIPTVVRNNGIAELTSDFELDCTGGAAGQNLVSDLLLIFGGTFGVTSKTTAGATEALLLINDPAPADQAPGVNVIQGLITQFTNEWRFPNVTLTQPGFGRLLKLRFTNLRVNALTVIGDVNQITASVETDPDFTIFFSGSETIGVGRAAWSTRLRSAQDTPYGGAAFSQCTPVNPGLAQSPAAPGGVVNFNIQFSEGFVSAFAPRMNLPTAPPEAARTPGAQRSGETGFYNPAFPATGGLNTAGLASQGTRLYTQFFGVPAGVSLYVTVTPSPFGTSAGTRTQFHPDQIGLAGAHLTAADAQGAGPYTPIAPTSTVTLNGVSVGIAPLTVSDGAARAVWEILQSDPFSSEDVSFGVLVAYNGQPSPATITMTRTMAPISGDNSPESQIVPRFSNADRVEDTLIISACGAVLPDLQITSLTAPTQAGAGTLIPVSATVLNASATPIPFYFDTSYSLFEDSGLSRPVLDNQPIACRLPNLAGNASAPCPAAYLVPGRLAPGTYFLGAAADLNGQVSESNEANNTAAVPLTVFPCRYELTRTSMDIPRGASIQGIAVHTGDGCPWAPITSDVAWLHVLFGELFGIGTGPQPLSFEAQANPGPAPRVGTLHIAGGAALTVNQAGAGHPSQIRVYRGGAWYADSNLNHAWNGTPTDQISLFGVPGDYPVIGDWDGSGQKRMGIYRDGLWYVDMNGNQAWDGVEGGDAIFSFGVKGDIPIVSALAGGGRLTLGVYRDGLWYIDFTANNQWDGVAHSDGLFAFGVPGDIPVIGDWDGTNFERVGVYRNGLWYIDLNGNRQWDGVEGGDALYSFGVAGDIPVMGDWDGSGKIRIGVYRNGLWYVDLNGNNKWDGTGPGGDAIFSFGVPGDKPIVVR